MPSKNTSPSRIPTTRSTRSSNPVSCVTISTVRSGANAKMFDMIAYEDSGSIDAVASSRIMIFASLSIARASVRRCFSPRLNSAP